MAGISGTGPFGAFTLTVTPEELLGQAATIDTEVQGLRELLDRMLSMAEKTDFYWKGDAAEAHRELFESVRPQMEELLRRYTEHNADLKQIAERYIETEHQVVQETDSLPVSPL
ncbi:MAG: WXG100 family type VII secretion target [Ruminococcaceae bacterium]|nr:WXG100 family type VII secretion target [Oscillospiraceae bacterium]